ncbi:MAG: hypothetical protein IKR04_02550 [Clostridia bacterium]|nr:hypothetical protein [Clostridia bacterium]
MDKFRSSRAEYVKSVEYKMVFILAGYRSILLVLGTDFLKNLAEYRYSNGKGSGLEANTMTLIDTGFAKLNMDEVRLYANYIAKIMKYDEEEFFDCLKDKAYRLEYIDEDNAKMTKCRINIMHTIDKNMV